MFWIQETGINKNNPNYKLFYAESKSDIDNMPTDIKQGTQENGDTVSNHLCSVGSECLCIDEGTLYILTTSGWTEV